MISRLSKEEKKTVLFVTHDIEEAILLSDRILFLGDKDIQADIEVELERPRTKEKLIGSQEFVQLHKQLMNLFYKSVADKIGMEKVMI